MSIPSNYFYKDGAYWKTDGSGPYTWNGTSMVLWSSSGGGGTSVTWGTPVSAPTYNMNDTDHYVEFTDTCEITGVSGLASSRWLFANVTTDKYVTWVAGGGTTAVPVGPYVIGPGEMMEVLRGSTATTWRVSVGFSWDDPFATETDLFTFAAGAGAGLLSANVTRAWVGFQQYGYIGPASTDWIRIGANMNVADFTTSAFTINGVAQAGANPWTMVVPAGVRSVQFDGCSAGAGGGGGFTAGAAGGGGGGGGGGVCTVRPMSARVVPGETLTATIPTPGTGGAVNAAGGSSSGPLTVVGSVSGLVFFIPKGGSAGLAGTATNGGAGGNSSEQTGFNVFNGGTSGTGAGVSGTIGGSNSGPGGFTGSSGASGGGATGTNAGGSSGNTYSYPIGIGGTGAASLGGGGAGGSGRFAKFSGGAVTTGGSNSSVNALTLTEATHGYGLGGGGGAAHATTSGTGAAGTGGFLRMTY